MHIKLSVLFHSSSDGVRVGFMGRAAICLPKILNTVMNSLVYQNIWSCYFYISLTSFSLTDLPSMFQQWLGTVSRATQGPSVPRQISQTSTRTPPPPSTSTTGLARAGTLATSK